LGKGKVKGEEEISFSVLVIISVQDLSGRRGSLYTLEAGVSEEGERECQERERVRNES
jgi:hypothetical protein